MRVASRGHLQHDEDLVDDVAHGQQDLEDVGGDVERQVGHHLDASNTARLAVGGHNLAHESTGSTQDT